MLRYRFERSGALVVQWLDLAEDRSHLLRIGPGGRVAVLAATGRGWEAVEIITGRSPRHGRVLVTFRTARSEGGVIEVRNKARNNRRRSVESSRRITGKDADKWHRVDLRRSGVRITTEGHGTLTSRAAVDARGLVLWRTAPTAGGSVMQQHGGGSPKTTKEIYVDKQGQTIGSHTTFEGPSGRGSSTELTMGGMTYQSTEWHGADGRDVSSEQWSDGRSGKSDHQEWSQDGGMSHSHRVQTESGPGGTTVHTTDVWQGNEKNPITGENNKVFHKEETHTDASGKTEVDRDASAGDGAGNLSSTHVHIGGDGSVSITTRTVDALGNGTEHTSVTDPTGKVVSDKTKRVGQGQTSDDESDSTEGDDDDNGDDGDDGDDDDAGDDGDEGVEGVEGGGDDDGDMDWEGSDDGRPKLPRITSSLDRFLDFPPGATEEEIQAMVEAYIEAVKALVRSAPEPGERPTLVPPKRDPTTAGGGQSGGATGEGDWGAEGPPSLKLRPGDWTTLGSGVGPTDDWGDWKDPRALIAHAQRLAVAVAADREADGVGVMRTLNSVRRIDGAVRRVRMRS